MERSTQQPINRRREPRWRQSRPGTLVLRDGKSTMLCNVCDLSPNGARLKVTGWRLLPDRFELRIHDGPTHQAEVRSRRAGVIGVRFVPVPET